MIPARCSGGADSCERCDASVLSSDAEVSLLEIPIVCKKKKKQERNDTSEWGADKFTAVTNNSTK